MPEIPTNEEIQEELAKTKARILDWHDEIRDAYIDRPKRVNVVPIRSQLDPGIAINMGSAGTYMMHRYSNYQFNPYVVADALRLTKPIIFSNTQSPKENRGIDPALVSLVYRLGTSELIAMVVNWIVPEESAQISHRISFVSGNVDNLNILTHGRKVEMFEVSDRIRRAALNDRGYSHLADFYFGYTPNGELEGWGARLGFKEESLGRAFIDRGEIEEITGSLLKRRDLEGYINPLPYIRNFGLYKRQMPFNITG